MRRGYMWILLIGGGILSLASADDKTCPADMFHCTQAAGSGSSCISRRWVCDGDLDCEGGTDERDCAQVTCKPQKFMCKDKSMCVPEGWRCDGEADCLDGSDETQELCTVKFNCPPGMYNCDGTNLCLEITQVCNGLNDCPDNSDEGPFCRRNLCSNKTCSNQHCRETVKGPVCHCPKGQYWNSTACVDRDECQYEQFCDQLCENRSPGYRCSCADGYIKRDDLYCQVDPSFGMPYLLVTNVTMVQKRHLNGSTVDSVSRIREQRIKHLVINVHNNSFCWLAQRGEEKWIVVCALMNNFDVRWGLEMEFSLHNVDQFALDWVSENWYFTDQGKERLFVCTYNGSTCYTLLTTNLRGPRAIAVDPVEGYFFFTTMGDSPKLERVRLDGSGRTLLASDSRMVRPNGLTLDFVKKQIYWADAYLDRIERVNYDGSGRTMVMKSTWVEGVQSLDMFETNLYTVNHRSQTLVRLYKYHHKDRPKEMLINDMPSLGSLRIYHPIRQPKPQVAPPRKKCPHVGVLMYNRTTKSYKETCLCRAGDKAVSKPLGEFACESAMEDRFLLYTNGRLGMVRGVSIVPGTPHDVIKPISGLSRPFAVDYDPVEKYIYYSDVNIHIGRQKLDGTDKDTSFIVEPGSNCEGIAIDWVSRNIYWTDERMRRVSVARLSNTTFNKTLVSDNLSHPRAIVVDPDAGYMYISDWVHQPSSGVQAKIEQVSLDGSYRRSLLSNTSQIQWPNGLSLDKKMNLLYWCDAYTDRIEALDLTTGVSVTVASSKQVHHPYGLAHWHDLVSGNLYFYWTEFTFGKIMRMDNATKKLTTIKNDSAPVFAIRFYDNNFKLKQNNCTIDNNGCSHLCLPAPGGPVCACADGYKLAVDKKSCIVDANYTSNNECDETKHRCSNGRCINKQWLCDGENDCGDNSDEMKGPGHVCQNYTCPDPPNMFNCKNNKCVYKRWMCDGEDDCGTGEDEDPAYCNTTSCLEGQVRCPGTYKCISKSWFCDHDHDCPGGYDEKNCTHATCNIHQFQCSSGRCISRQYVCDGDNDCRDNSDEEGCQTSTCDPVREFTCNITQKCIHKIFVCDGDNNCGDHSDEQNCDNRNVTCMHDNEFHCDNGICILKKFTCDDDDDCGDGSDERYCNSTSKECADDEFMCIKNRHCVTRAWLCDGATDCEDGSDEFNCTTDPPAPPCKYPERSCKDDPKRCVKPEQLCDTFHDCTDGSDEGGLCGYEMCINHDCSHNCSEAPEGFMCLCPPGKRIASDKKNCVDANPCEKWGVCSQGCVDLGDSHMCSCFDGFSLEKADQFTCKPEDDVDTYIILSSRHEIRRIDIKSSSYVSMVSGLRNTIALDFYYNKTSKIPGEGSLVFWTDVVDDKIYRATMIANSVTNIEDIINVGIVTAEGLAVDWIGENIYWAESNLDQIEVAKFDGSKRTTIIAGEMESPRAIVLDPRVGMLFWSDWQSGSPRIEKASMSGEGREIIFRIDVQKNGGWPNGLTADYDAQRLYWIDARSDTIHTVMYDGSDERVILKKNNFLNHPFAITLFGNYMYWTDWRSNSVVRANKWNGSDISVMARLITQPFDVHIFHPKRQPSASNPCKPGTCGDDALCLLTFDRKAQCKCPHLKKLGPDGRNCIDEGTFLIFAKKQEIRGVDMDNGYFNVIPSLTVPFVYNPLAIDFDPLEGKLYWTDDDGVAGIHSAKLDGKNVSTIIDSGIQNPSGFAIDWISRNMYFSSYGSLGAKIIVATLKGAFRTDILEGGKTGSARLKKPNSLAVHPVKGLLFWTDHEGDGSINRADMDGSKPVLLLSRNMTNKRSKRDTIAHPDIPPISKPSGLTIDYQKNRLWWINVENARTSIMNCDFDGNDIQLYLTIDTQQSTSHPGALAVYNNSVFYTKNEQKGSIHVGKQGRNDKGKVLRQNSPDVRAMKIYSQKHGNDADQNVCSNNSGCSQLCLPSSNTSVCRCTVGFRKDGKDCKPIKDFLMYTTTGITGISLDPTNRDLEALPSISRVQSAASVDFHSREDYVYWADSHFRTISRIKRDLTERHTLVSDGLGRVDGIAVDWLAGNIYWTDQRSDVIEVARLNGSSRYVIISTGLEKPRNIVVDPIRGYLYWTDWGVIPKIERSRLDGSERTTLIKETDITHPFGLALDHKTQNLYWCDQRLNKIEKVDLNVSPLNRTIIVNTSITDCMGLAVHGDYIYWSDITEQEGSIKRANKTNGQNMIVMRKKLGPQIKDVRIFSESQQPQNDMNHCVKNNGGCQELCFFMGREAERPRCQCAHGKLVKDTKCVDHDSFLLFSSVTAIQSIHMFDVNNPNDPIRPIQSVDKHVLRNVIGLSFDYPNKRIFFSDIQRGNIQSVGFDGKDFRNVVINIGSAEGLAYDQIYEELYWTSYTNSSISRVRIGNTTSLPERVIQLGTDDHPRAIVLDACKLKIFWTNWNDKQASIQTSTLAGTGLQSIVTSRIRTPNGLTIDHKAHKLYWSDARLDKIERVDYDGGNRKVILTQTPRHVFGLAVYGDFLYWTDWILHAVIRVNKYTGGDITWLRKNTPRQPMAIVAVANDTNNCSHVCDIRNGGCSHNCDTDERGQVICSCKEGFLLMPDSVTCRLQGAKCLMSEFVCNNSLCLKQELVCDGRDHCGDNSDENRTMCYSRKCPENFFHCVNTKCLHISKRCDGVDDCGDGSDETSCGCEPGEFRCKNNGTCIKAGFRCNFERDCWDASDEMGCAPHDCSYFAKQSGVAMENMTLCPNTSACIMESWRCDGHNDCWDNYDEMGCPTDTPVTKCKKGMFHCNYSNECLPAFWRCDGDIDCHDGTDEKNCETVCSADKFQCDKHLCIQRSWVCDGHLDCYDGTDEKNCSQTECSAREFKCTSTGNCILRDWLCDGDRDCHDGEDEMDGAACKPRACEKDEFQCGNYRCIRQEFYCDGDQDCGDGSDEPDDCEQIHCSLAEFKCDQSNLCVPLFKMCDGILDCPDHSDENPRTCQTSIPPCSEPGQFLCNNSICINDTLVCDDKDDCGDYSDETSCGYDHCKRNTVCEHVCHNRKTTFECGCLEGYKLNEDKRTCKDINECTSYPCSQYCINTDGSYRCSCADGYRLAPNKHSCKTVGGDEAVLLVANRYYIRNISLSGYNVQLLARNLTNAVAVDYDMQDEKIYWSDVTTIWSRISRMNKNGSNHEVLHSGTLSNPDGIAVDWVGRNLYWCDKATDTIEVSKLDGQYRKVLIKSGLREPRALVVHPMRGYLYYTDWGDHPHIGSVGMDGSQHNSSFISSNLGWPNALTIDYVTEHLIWADARHDYIAMADIYGRNIRYILKENLPHVFAVSVFEDYIYWSDWERKSIERAHKYSGKNRTTLATTIHRPMDIQVYHAYRQKIIRKKAWRNPCEDPCGVGMLCLIKPGGLDRACMCPEHHHPSVTKQQCIANCTSSQILCRSTYQCIPFWWQCDGRDDCRDGSDEPPGCRTYHCKQPGMYQCMNASGPIDCIASTQICDGIPQCKDGSDEVNCGAHTCMESQFKCQADNKCIPSSARCNSQRDCSDGADEAECPEHTCASNQFKCSNGKCIPYVWYCDGDNDCTDNSDEPTNCQLKNSTCRPEHFHCSVSGRCIPQSWVCDGEKDCRGNDDSDENPTQCVKKTCEPSYFRCDNSLCIPGRWKCDYDDDCRDGSDERNCTPRNCSESEWRCDNGRCIMASWKCDGETHCDDGSDERNCTKRSCTSSQISCSSKHCIPKEWRCDLDLDCKDGSDEDNCEHSCSAQEFQCNDSTCIPYTWKCDGTRDCRDASDEKPDLCNRTTCLPSLYHCGNGQCIPKVQVCDGVDQCGDSSDEEHCPRECRADQFKCKETAQCIDYRRVCDNYTDCADNSDEGDICASHRICDNTTRCMKNFTCQQYMFGSRCICQKGFEQAEDGVHCQDKDECLDHTSCSQLCQNLVGRYKCSCDKGFYRSENNSSLCKATGPPPYLVMAVDGELWWTEVRAKGDVGALYSSQPQMKVRSVAVHIKRSLVFFICQANNTIYRMSIPPNLTEIHHRGHSRYRRSNAGSVKDLQIKGMESPQSVSVDWLAERVYWTDNKKRTIESADLNGKNHVVLINLDIDRPHTITVDPLSRKMFWSDWGLIAKIEMANLDGSDRNVLVKSQIQWPTGIAVDYPAQRLYWADTKLKKIETILLNGKGRAVVRKFAESDKAPYGLEVFGDHLYYTSFPNKNLFMMSKFNDGEPKIMTPNLPVSVNDIIIVQEKKQKQQDNLPCKTSTCGKNAICINLPIGHSCVCLVGFKPVNTTDCALAKPATPPPNPCHSNPCHNKGTCHHTDTGVAKCRCSPRFTGPMCQIDRCRHFCNRGICEPKERNITCRCEDGYEGLRCEQYKCSGHCLNGGRCYIMPGTNEPKCRCPYTHTGPTCKEQVVDVCANFECYNGGSCILKQGRPHCSCVPLFTGKKCELCHTWDCGVEGSYCKRNGTGYRCVCPKGFFSKMICPTGSPCRPRCHSVCKDFCSNGGTCQLNENNKPTCSCPPDYEGVHCATHVCENYCKNGGTCDLHQDGQKICTCRENFTGLRCETAKACTKNPCLNGGTCIPDKNGDIIRCTCALGYQGPHCEVHSGCEDKCQHGGTCAREGTRFYCRCPKGWSGHTCAHKMPFICTQMCGDGYCTQCDLTQKAPCLKCRCPSDRTGKWCELAVKRHASSESIAIAIPVILLILVIVIVTAVCLYKRRHVSQFSRKRLQADSTSNIQITNPLYNHNFDEEGTEGTPFTIEAEKQPTNFANPMYDTMYSDSGLLPDSEKNKLLPPDEESLPGGDTYT